MSLRSSASCDASREALIGASLKSEARTGGRRPGADTEEEPSMFGHRNQPSSSPPPDAVPVVGLIRTHWVLSVCVVCGHERPHGERHRAACPTCGAQLRSFALYRELQAGQ